MCVCVCVYICVEGAICNVNNEKKVVVCGRLWAQFVCISKPISPLLLGKLFTQVDAPPWMSESSPKKIQKASQPCVAM